MEKERLPRVVVNERESRVTREELVTSEKVVDERRKNESLIAIGNVARRHEESFRKRIRRRKWLGGTSIVLGTATLMGASPFYFFSLIGPESLLAGFAMIIGGGVLSALRPKMKASNQAILVAAKYGNRLTVTRLALEMDISVKKAEKIIQGLVANSVAEIDLTQDAPEEGLVYHVKGL